MITIWRYGFIYYFQRNNKVTQKHSHALWDTLKHTHFKDAMGARNMEDFGQTVNYCHTKELFQLLDSIHFLFLLSLICNYG